MYAANWRKIGQILETIYQLCTVNQSCKNDNLEIENIYLNYKKILGSVKIFTVSFKFCVPRLGTTKLEFPIFTVIKNLKIKIYAFPYCGNFSKLRRLILYPTALRNQRYRYQHKTKSKNGLGFLVKIFHFRMHSKNFNNMILAVR